MKIVCILIVLTTLFGHSKGAVANCKAKADATVQNPGEVTFAADNAVCGDGETDFCSRPKIVAGAFLTDGVKWGCGACGTPDNCVTCTSDNCNIDAVTCWSTVAQAAEDAEYCTGTVQQCKRPKVNIVGEWTGDDTNWGCGACGEAVNCVNCASAGDLCNTKDTTSLAKHSCLEYKRDTDTNTWVKDSDNPNVNCYTEGGSADGCKMPAPSNGETEFEVCGNDCEDGNSETCQGCAAADCNDVDKTDDSIILCKKGDADSAADAVLPSVFCDGSCKRPAVAYGEVVGTNVEYGCGNCDNVANCEACTTDNCNTFPETESFNCFTWTWDDTNSKFTVAAQKTCQAGDGEEKKCNMPTKDAANPEQNDIARSGCGTCVAAAEKCTTTEAGKNVETTHKCHTWSWNDADGKKTWEFTKDAVDCYTADTATKCSLPEDRSKKDGFVGNGCTACGTDDANCMTTEKEENSGRRVIFSLLALALPIFYALL